jgi:hypothetical protein
MTQTTYPLISGGDTAEIDGHNYRLVITPDHDVSINDYDCYGRYDWGDQHRYSGQSVPPHDYDLDRTERLTILNDVVWWERPEDFHRLPPKAQSDFRWMVSELISFGFHVLTVERTDGTDHYGKPIVVDAHSVGGVDTLDAEIVGDLANELIYELQTRI